MIRRHSRRVWLLWALGALILLSAPFAISDPAVLTFILDPELLALVASVGSAVTRGNPPRGGRDGRLERRGRVRRAGRRSGR